MIRKQYVGIFSVIFAFVFPYIFEKAFFPDINIHTYLWFVVVLLFISLHFFMDIKRMWDAIYKYRWVLCLILLFSVLMLEYNTSSIGLYDKYIEPDSTSKQYQPLFNELQPIRSDEWGGNTPLRLSQYRLSKPFSVTNDIIMAKDNIVTIYPNYPTKSISVISNPRFWGYILFGENKGLTVDTMFEWIILIFVSFDFMMIITKKRKVYSLAGALFLAFSPAIIWWTSYNIILYGEAIVVLVNCFVHAKKKWKKLLCSIGIGWLIACDIMSMYPAWLIPFSYIYLIMVLSLLIKNTKKKDVLSTIGFVFLAFAIGAGLVIPNYLASADVFELVNNTVYPGKRFSVGGVGCGTLFNYSISLFLWHKQMPNSSEVAQYIGFYPLPLILGLLSIGRVIYANRKKKEGTFKNVDLLFAALVMLELIFSINIFFPMPILSKLTLLSYSPPQRLSVAINYMSILILFRYISLYEKTTISKKQVILLGTLGLLIGGCFLFLASSLQPDYLTIKYKVCVFILFTIAFICILLNYKKVNVIFLSLFGVLNLVAGILVNPISNNSDVLYTKPLAKEIAKITKEDRDSVWISLNNSFVVGNYLAANGAKTINTTNAVPNMELWKQLDEDRVYNDVYNRYAYFMMFDTKEESYFKLEQQDLMSLYINLNDLVKLKVDYIVTSKPLDIPTKKDNYKLEQIYKGSNQLIYKVSYKTK